MLIYLFGLPAAGKNFAGQALAEELGFHFHDGDLDLTDELRQAVRDGRPFTDAMRDRYFAVLLEVIGDLAVRYPRLAFGQATFKERHRRLVLERFPETQFVLVTANEDARLARLARGDNPVTVDYARRIAAFFEPPRHPYVEVVNNGDRAVLVEQLRGIVEELTQRDAKQAKDAKEEKS